MFVMSKSGLCDKLYAMDVVIVFDDMSLDEFIFCVLILP